MLFCHIVFLDHKYLHTFWLDEITALIRKLQVWLVGGWLSVFFGGKRLKKAGTELDNKICINKKDKILES